MNYNDFYDGFVEEMAELSEEQRRDLPLLREHLSMYIDRLARNGQITANQAQNWDIAFVDSDRRGAQGSVERAMSRVHTPRKPKGC